MKDASQNRLSPDASARSSAGNGWATRPWARRSLPLRTRATPGRTLRLYIPRDEPEWESVARQYAEGRLGSLAPVQSSRTAVVERGPAGPGERIHYFKRFLMRSSFDWLKHLLRPSRARRAWKGSRLAAGRGFDVPRPVCVLEIRLLGVVLGSAIVTEAARADAASLDNWLAGGPHVPPLPPDRRKALAAGLGAEIGRLHAAALVHGDLRHSNILCWPDGPSFRFILLDNERTRRSHSEREKARNLVQLNMARPGLLSPADRIAFWHAYCRQCPLPPRQRRRLRTEVAGWTARRLQKLGWE